MKTGESLVRTHSNSGSEAFADGKHYAKPKTRDAGRSSGRFRGIRKFGVAPGKDVQSDRYREQGVGKYATGKLPPHPWLMREQAMAMYKQSKDSGDALVRDLLVDKELRGKIDPNTGQPLRGHRLVRKQAAKTNIKTFETESAEGTPNATIDPFEGQQSMDWRDARPGESELHEALSPLDKPTVASEPIDRHDAEVASLPTTDQSSTEALPSRNSKMEQESENYEDLLLLIRALQQAECSSEPSSFGLRHKGRAQLTELVDSLNGESMTISEKRHLLRKVLGQHTTIASEADKRTDYLWTTHKIPPRNMPRSIIWLDRTTGNVELIPPELKRLEPGKSVNHRNPSVTSPKELNHRANIAGYDALRTVVARCGELLTGIQAAQRTGQGDDGENVKAEMAELQECIIQLNEDFARERRVHFNVVRTAMTAELGVPGRFWTKLEPDGRKSILWYHETSGKTELVLKQAGESVADVEGEQTSSTSKKVKSEPESTRVGRAQAVLEIRKLLDQCRRYLVIVQQKEKTTQSAHRGRRELLAAQNKVVEIVDKVNVLAETGQVELSDLKFAVKRGLGNRFDLWSFAQPDGEKTLVWLKDDQRQLVVVGKVTPVHSDELLKMQQERTQLFDHKVATHENHATMTRGKAQDDRGPAWDEVRDWMRSQTAAAENLDTGRRGVNDASPKPVRDDMPVSVPYTTAASTFVYGANAVLASLSAKKRKFYRLYFAGSEAHVAAEDSTKEQIQKLGREADIPTTFNTSKQLLDKMSDRRPHNGIALEASQIPAPPVLGIGKPDMHHSIIPVQLDRQSPEEIVVNGAPTALPLITNTWRHPFILMLDGILDEGNLGNIMRTAYFYGVDAIAVSKNTCASVNSPIVAKASSGAIEAMQILSLQFPSKFIFNCLRSSWRVYAAVPPPAIIPSSETGKYLTHASVASRSPLQDHACILMLGAEGEGLRGNLKTRADYFVSIEQGERASMAGGLLPGIGVDSMNVSSAAGVLVESFMRKPQGAQPLGAGTALGF